MSTSKQLCVHLLGVNLQYQRKLTSLRGFLRLFNVIKLEQYAHQPGVEIHSKTHLSTQKKAVRSFKIMFTTS